MRRLVWILATCTTLACGGDTGPVMETCDVGDLKHTLYMPYEMLVSDGTVYALHAKFRIALSFPDLGMVTFMKISGAPGAIERALRSASSDTK